MNDLTDKIGKHKYYSDHHVPRIYPPYDDEGGSDFLDKINKQYLDHCKYIGDLKVKYQERQKRKWRLICYAFIFSISILLCSVALGEDTFEGDISTVGTFNSELVITYPCYICYFSDYGCVNGKNHYLGGSEISDLQKEIAELKQRLDWFMQVVLWQVDVDGKKTTMFELYKYNKKDDKYYPSGDRIYPKDKEK